MCAYEDIGVCLSLAYVCRFIGAHCQDPCLEALKSQIGIASHAMPVLEGLQSCCWHDMHHQPDRDQHDSIAWCCTCYITVLVKMQRPSPILQEERRCVYSEANDNV